jgi:hypothetical protein
LPADGNFPFRPQVILRIATEDAMRHAVSLALVGLAAYACGRGCFDQPREQHEQTGADPTRATIPLDIPTRAALDAYIAGRPGPKPTRADVVAEALHDWLAQKGLVGGGPA